MDTYEQKNNVKTTQGTHLWFSQMKQALKKVLRQGFKGGHASLRNERLPSDEQLFHRGWHLLFESRPRHPRACCEELREPEGVTRDQKVQNVCERHGEERSGNDRRKLGEAFHFCRWISAFAGMTQEKQDIPISLTYRKSMVWQPFDVILAEAGIQEALKDIEWR